MPRFAPTEPQPGAPACRRRAGRARRSRSLGLGAILAALASLAAAAPAQAGEEILGAAGYPEMSTYSCRTDPIPISPGQNLNLFGATKTCPHAQKLSGPGDASVFGPGGAPAEQGYITRFKPSMVELLAEGGEATPSVWDLHLHHVVWLDDGPTFASGEEKTIPKLPPGYGYGVGSEKTWGLNYMIHSLNASQGRSVQITWEIDWVPASSPSGAAIKESEIRWLDVAGAPQLYPVFDAERRFDLDGDKLFTFPDDVPTDPALPGYEERQKISNARAWTVPDGMSGNKVTLLFTAGHLHPGGLSVDLFVERNGVVKPLFRSDARYYEPAGAVSWDVSMKATRPGWRVSLKEGDTVFINATYDLRRGSWYESMGIMPLSWSDAPDPAARDPFDDAAEVQAMYEAGGILTHGRLPENIDKKAKKDLGLPSPKKVKSKGTRVPAGGIEIDSFVYETGGFSAVRDFPRKQMRPPVIRPGQSVTFTNLDALPEMSQTEQAWHSITSCPLPCNKGSGIGYPLARGKVEYDSGQLGYGTGGSSEVTTGSNVYTTPAFEKPGTYAYFCRIHPFMRGSIRVKERGSGGKKGGGKRAAQAGL